MRLRVLDAGGIDDEVERVGDLQSLQQRGGVPAGGGEGEPQTGGARGMQ